jgi:hypothetical protein
MKGLGSVAQILDDEIQSQGPTHLVLKGPCRHRLLRSLIPGLSEDWLALIHLRLTPKWGGEPCGEIKE